MLFNYDGCCSCCSMQDDINLSLFNKFPAGVCNTITSFLVCNECEVMLKRETEFERKYADRYNDCSKIELQLKFFTIYNTPPFNKSDIQKVKFKKLQEIVMRNADDELKKVMVSFMKMSFYVFRKETVPHLDSMKILKKTADIHETIDFPYYNKIYPCNTLIKLILCEYILELIGDHIMYMDLEDIHKYLDEIFD